MSTPPVRGGIARRGLHAQVVDTVGHRIVVGELEPGSVLDLGALEAEFGVSHTAMREAIKVLTAKQLLDARPKLGTYVLPRVHWNLLDPDVMAWRDADVRLQEELADARVMMEPAAARLAAIRANEADLERLRVALELMGTGLDDARSASDDRWDDVVDADVEFHAAIASATGNELFERLQRILVPAMRARDKAILPKHHDVDFIEHHRNVLDAIAARDPERAGEAMINLLAQSRRDLASHAGAGSTDR